MPINDLFTPLTYADLEEIDIVLCAHENDDGIIDVSEFDGLITAVVSAPEMIMPSAWLGVVWGGQEPGPVGGSMEERNRILALMIRHMNTTSATLKNNPSNYDPCFLEMTVGDITQCVADEWCVGYMKGVEMFPRQLQLETALHQLLSPIRLFAAKEGWEVLESKNDNEIASLQEQIAPAVRAIHRHCVAPRSVASPPSLPPWTSLVSPPTPFVHTGPKVGRNAPCPCGSGNKYKKCCGVN